MIKSMTAFARAQKNSEFGDIIIEIRSVNHRYLETNFKIPDDFRSQEMEYRKQISQHISRGKLDICIRYKLSNTHQSEIVINKDLIKDIRKAEQTILDIAHESHALDVADILAWPGVIQENQIDLSMFFPVIDDCLTQALADLTTSREKEGKAIMQMLTTRCDDMLGIIHQVELRRTQVLEAIQQKWKSTLNEKLTQWADTIEPGRVEQELLIIAQKLDVDEEIDRLKTHLQEIKEVLIRDEPVGRRLDFLMQELNREANTLSSKSQDSQTTQHAVDLKVLIEQMREQIQNIE